MRTKTRRRFAMSTLARAASGMRAVNLVARWEFVSSVMRGSFLAGVLVLPLVHLGIAALLIHAMRSAARDEKPKSIAIVDVRGLLPGSPAGGDDIVRDEARALDELRAARLDAVFVLADDYLETGRLRSYVRRTPGLFVFADNVARRDRAAALIRHALAGSVARTDIARRIEDPAVKIERFALDRHGVPAPDAGSLGFVGGAFGMCFLLSLSVFLSSGLLQQAMAAERQNRVLEVVLALVGPLPLITGKVVGLAGASLVQMGTYLGLLLGAAPTALGMFDIPPSTIVLSIACWLVGYIFFACLMAAMGALGRDTQESAQLAMPWMLLAASPLFFIASIGSNPGSGLARALSWIPLTSPVTLLLRLGAEGVSWIELAGALAVTLACALGILAAASALLGRLAVSGGFSLLTWVTALKGQGVKGQ